MAEQVTPLQYNEISRYLLSLVHNLMWVTQWLQDSMGRKD